VLHIKLHCTVWFAGLCPVSCSIPQMMFAMQVEAVKLFVLKTINLATLVYQLFVIQTNANSAQQYLRLSNYNDYLSVSLQSFLHTV